MHSLSTLQLIYFLGIACFTQIHCKPGAHYKNETRPHFIELGKLDSIKTMNGISLPPDQKKLYSSWVISRDKNAARKYQTRIFEHENRNGIFDRGKLISFSSRYVDYHPVISPDGKKMFFNSLRPLPGDTVERTKNNIWVSEYMDGSWQEPELIKGMNYDSGDSYPSVAGNGNLYFISEKPGSKKRDIYVSYYKNGTYSTPTAIPELNSGDDENDITVDPTERFLVFNVYRFATKQIDMCIAYKQKNGWSKPQVINAALGGDTASWNLTPAFTPDGKWFLFERDSRIEKIPLDSILKMSKTG